MKIHGFAKPQISTFVKMTMSRQVTALVSKAKRGQKVSIQPAEAVFATAVMTRGNELRHSISLGELCHQIRRHDT